MNDNKKEKLNFSEFSYKYKKRAYNDLKKSSDEDKDNKKLNFTKKCKYQKNEINKNYYFQTY